MGRPAGIQRRFPDPAPLGGTDAELAGIDTGWKMSPTLPLTFRRFHSSATFARLSFYEMPSGSASDPALGRSGPSVVLPLNRDRISLCRC